MEPLNMVLPCPKCGLLHIDAPDLRCPDGVETATGTFDPTGYDPEDCAGCGCHRSEHVHWTNPPHKSHLCHGCGTIWRPADVPTNGVATVQTRGKADTWPMEPPA